MGSGRALAAGEALILRGRPRHRRRRRVGLTRAMEQDLVLGPRVFLIDTFAISLAAWLGSIPLAAYYFHIFNIVSTPANWIVVPLTASVAA